MIIEGNLKIMTLKPFAVNVRLSTVFQLLEFFNKIR